MDLKPQPMRVHVILNRVDVFVKSYYNKLIPKKLNFCFQEFTEHLQLSEACIRDIKNVLHPLNVNYARLLDAAFDGCIEVGDFEKALDYGIRALEPCRSEQICMHSCTDTCIWTFYIAPVIISQEKCSH